MREPFGFVVFTKDSSTMLPCNRCMFLSCNLVVWCNCIYVFHGSFIEGRHRKKLEGGKTNSSESLNSSDNEDRKKDDRFNKADDKHDNEAQVWLWSMQSISLANSYSRPNATESLLYICLCYAAATHSTGYGSITWGEIFTGGIMFFIHMLHVQHNH